jgi:hypothetical protein
MLKRIATYLLTLLGLLPVLNLSLDAQEDGGRAFLDLGRCEARVVSTDLRDVIDHGRGEIRPHDRHYRLAVVELGLRSSDGGTLAFSPGGFSIVFERDGGPRCVTSRALGIIGTDETGETKQQWIEADARSISSISYSLKQDEERRFQLAFALPEGVEEFVLNLPSAVPGTVRVK